jgi:hypothetical protein
LPFSNGRQACLTAGRDYESLRLIQPERDHEWFTANKELARRPGLQIPVSPPGICNPGQNNPWIFNPRTKHLFHISNLLFIIQFKNRFGFLQDQFPAARDLQPRAK